MEANRGHQLLAPARTTGNAKDVTFLHCGGSKPPGSWAAGSNWR
jgi:hypothetical protein